MPNTGRILKYDSCQALELRFDGIEIQTYSERITHILEYFWSRWTTEYLEELREQHKSVDKDMKVVVKRSDCYREARADWEAREARADWDIRR